MRQQLFSRKAEGMVYNMNYFSSGTKNIINQKKIILPNAQILCKLGDMTLQFYKVSKNL